MMHLLQHHNNGDFSLASYFSHDIPPYAVLSHTWGPEGDEVTFQDLTNGTGKGKTGYSKIRFCGEEARRDGLQCFWVDTCCIDKSNSTELAEAINSMFRLFAEAVKCYVYCTCQMSQYMTSIRMTTFPSLHGSQHFEVVNGLLGAGRFKN
jgi:hypothetical protein